MRVLINVSTVYTLGKLLIGNSSVLSVFKIMGLPCKHVHSRATSRSRRIVNCIVGARVTNAVGASS